MKKKRVKVVIETGRNPRIGDGRTKDCVCVLFNSVYFCASERSRIEERLLEGKS